MLLVLQAALHVVLAPLAYATAVDPLWIPGIYDGADHDDVLGVLLDDSPAVGPGGRVVDAEAPRSKRLVTTGPTSPLATSGFCANHLRSPPTS
jgi:hypothetical protein